jgi:hypothetical protein
MKKSSQEDIIEIIAKIQTGTFSRRDIKLLLLEIRDEVSSSSALRDIANFIHPERDQGSAFKKIEGDVKNFLDIAENSGKLVVRPIYNQNDLLVELLDTLKHNGFSVDESAFKKQTPRIVLAMAEFLEGTKINIKNVTVKDCHLKILKTNLCFCFSLSEPINGILKIPTNITVAMPFFEEQSPS